MSRYKLVIVRDNGDVQETECNGYHAESVTDELYWKAIKDKRTVYACTVSLSEDGSLYGLRQDSATETSEQFNRGKGKE